MLNIFKSSLAKTSILDDFSFYEDQAKSKGSRHPLPPLGINSNTKSPVSIIIHFNYFYLKET